MLGSPTFSTLCISPETLARRDCHTIPHLCAQGCAIKVGQDVHTSPDLRPSLLLMRASLEIPLQRSDVPVGHPICWDAAGCAAGVCTHGVISQITFMISLISKTKTTRNIWEFALKEVYTGRCSYKTFHPCTAAIKVCWSEVRGSRTQASQGELLSNLALTASCNLFPTGSSQPSVSYPQTRVFCTALCAPTPTLGSLSLTLGCYAMTLQALLSKT